MAPAVVVTKDLAMWAPTFEVREDTVHPETRREEHEATETQ